MFGNDDGHRTIKIENSEESFKVAEASAVSLPSFAGSNIQHGV